MKKILFPTDFSEHSPQYLRYALKLAKTFDATLIAMHVYGDEETMTLPKKKQEEMADQLSDVLHDFIDKNKDREFEEVKIEYIVDMGMPGTEIVDVALEEDIELIVIGMTGKANISDNLFGSTSLAVINKADCPVLAIPATYTFRNPKRFVFLTDFVFRDIGVLQTLKGWSKVMDTKVNCLHVVAKNEDGTDAAIKMNMLKDVFHNPDINDFELRKGKLVDQTIQYLEENDIDIVATLSRKRNVLQLLLEGSKTKKVAKKLDRPILVFKENAYKPVLPPVDFSKFSIA